MGEATPWTAEQRAIVDHPDGAHALVRAVPGAGKTTTLVGRVVRLCERGVDPRRIRVVMFNRSIEEVFRGRLAARGITGVRVSTFDSLGLEVLRAAERRGLLRRPLEVMVDGTERWAREIYRGRRDDFEDEEELSEAIAFWKAHLVTPQRAAAPDKPALVEGYAQFEELRLQGGVLRVAFADMVYTAVAVLREHPRLLGSIDHFLVDEFQDVNLARVTLIQRLSHARTAITAVGDEDQAINEWCGANPRFYREFSRLFPWLPTREYPLPHSFRFGATIAAAATRLIAHNSERGGEAIVGAGRSEGAIVETDDICRAIAELRSSGVPAREIAVLYRSRLQCAGVLARLAAGRVAIDTEDFEWLRKGRAAELALAYLRFSTSDARPSLIDAWRVVFAGDRYIQKEAFAKQLALRGAWGLTATLADRELAREMGQSPSAVEAMSELAATLQRMGRCATAGEALQVLQKEVDVSAQLSWRAGRSGEPAETSFAAFCEFVAGLEVSPARAAVAVEGFDPTYGADREERVWVSTIHKAKGREWRAVVLPSLAEQLCPAEGDEATLGTSQAPEGIEQSPRIEQERRIFYVGLTRASERVYVQPVSPASRFLAELREVKPTAPVVRRRPETRDESVVIEADPEAEEVAAARPRARGKSWNAAEKRALAEAWARGEDPRAIAAKLGRSVGAVAHRVVVLGLADDVEEVMLRAAE
jgi:DNA helicase-2/ATP-dependent DNA helicase PcrA